MAMAIATPMAHLLLGTTRAQASLPAAPLVRPLLHRACQFPPLLLRPRLHSPSLPRLASRRFSSKPQAPLSPTQPPNKVRTLHLSPPLFPSLRSLSHFHNLLANPCRSRSRSRGGRIWSHGTCPGMGRRP